MTSSRGGHREGRDEDISQDLHLESQLLEEPLVLAALVLLLELHSDHHTCLLFLHGVLQGLLVEVGLVEGELDGVPSRHHVVVVHHLQEWFDGRPPEPSSCSSSWSPCVGICRYQQQEHE